ncbi:MAG: TetR/AcrR family transcriptional regulator [Propionibacteriaceae bacterium]|nr:TetR/AcrR family transcriptional regulator [Propionibacteriaceae bacterium]
MVQLALDPNDMRRLEQAGLVTGTFRRLDPDRQRAVAAAILTESLERGPSRVRLKETAAVAGVSVGSLYQYFGNREGVLDFAIELVSQALVAELRGFIPMLATLPLRDGLRAWVTGGMEWSQEQAAVLSFFVRGAYEGDPMLGDRLVAPVAAVMLEAISTMIAAAVERGEARTGLDLPATARAVHALLAAIADGRLLPHLGRYLLVSDDPVAFDRTLDAALDLVCNGLEP